MPFENYICYIHWIKALFDIMEIVVGFDRIKVGLRNPQVVHSKRNHLYEWAICWTCLVLKIYDVEMFPP